MSWVAARGGGRGTSTARRRACCTAQGRPARPFLPLDLSFPVCTIRELNKKKKDDPRLFSVNDLDSRPLLSRGDSAAPGRGSPSLSLDSRFRLTARVAVPAGPGGSDPRPLLLLVVAWPTGVTR